MDLNYYRQLNADLSRAYTKCQYALDVAGIPAVVDEMSILLTPVELSSYKNWALYEEGDAPDRKTPWMGWFNSSSDTMTMESDAGGDGPSFQVAFEFFKGQLGGGEELPWRVEAMAVLGGFAPLHRDPTGRVVHASYKLKDEVEYEGEMKKLPEFGMTPVAHYRNAYGRFSYWENGDFPWGAEDRPIYLKPRVNLRDS